MPSLMMCRIFVGMEQLEMVMALIKLIKVQLTAEREVAVAGVTDMAPGRKLFTHLWMHSATASARSHGTCPASNVLLEISDCLLERYVEELQAYGALKYLFALPCTKP